MAKAKKSAGTQTVSWNETNGTNGANGTNGTNGTNGANGAKAKKNAGAQALSRSAPARLSSLFSYSLKSPAYSLLSLSALRADKESTPSGAARAARAARRAAGPSCGRAASGRGDATATERWSSA